MVASFKTNGKICRWLLSDILTGVLERLLIPRNETSRMECPLRRRVGRANIKSRPPMTASFPQPDKIHGFAE
jgi:hypothetical protein